MTSKLFTAATNTTYTENGALSNISTLSPILDAFYHLPARRGQDNTKMIDDALKEDEILATQLMFYVRDVRGGQGERETFRQFLRMIDRSLLFDKVLHLIPLYGRWDDLLEFVDNPKVVRFVKQQLKYDFNNTKGISLLGKWMPSENTSSYKTRTLARKWIDALEMTPVQYRKMLRDLRNKINVVESKMSANDWKNINYEGVPSYAMKNYKKAFERHDPKGFSNFLSAVESGEKTIKASTLYPYDLVGQYLKRGSIDRTVESQWKALPNYADTDENALVVCDVSGSMFNYATPQAIEISVSLAIYIAERNKGLFHNQFITFSQSPKFITMRGTNLYEKVREVHSAEWGMNTDLQAVFTKLLGVAQKHKLPESEMPTKIFIVSDMQFDYCVNGGTNLDNIRNKYENAGYKLPVVVFWNVESRNKETPATMNENGVMLVSGASPSIFEMAVKSKALTPYEIMLEKLNSERYHPVLHALK